MSIELTTDFDGAWKEALEQFFPAFVEFFWPAAYAAIDWTQPYIFREHELHQVTRDAVLGKRRVDKLVQVVRKGGGDHWVLVHIEIQSQVESDFAERMYIYNYRIFDRFRRRVASFSVLGDVSGRWRPDGFRYDLWGSRVDFRYPVVKLKDYRRRWAELEANANPFAVVVMAHLETQATQQDAMARRRAKLALIKRLYRVGFVREQVVGLFRFIDWVMRLPPALEQELWHEVLTMDEEGKMAYMTYFERIGHEQGLQEGEHRGLLAAIALGLELKFGAEGVRFYPTVEPIRDNERLRRICDSLKTAATLSEVATVAGVEERSRVR